MNKEFQEIAKAVNTLSNQVIKILGKNFIDSQALKSEFYKALLDLPDPKTSVWHYMKNIFIFALYLISLTQQYLYYNVVFFKWGDFREFLGTIFISMRNT